MFLIPRDSKVSSIHTAFCSYHDNTIVSRKSFTPHLNTFASAKAICIAE